jgi:hypothetical protein
MWALPNCPIIAPLRPLIHLANHHLMTRLNVEAYVLLWRDAWHPFGWTQAKLTRLLD